MPVGDPRDAREFGATGDGHVRDTDALQAALDDCADEGGTVVVPPGTYRTGPLTVGDETTLDVRAGARIEFIDDHEAYPDSEGRWEGWLQTGVHPCLLVEDATDVTITGRGTIDGGGPYWWQLLGDGEPPGDLEARFERLCETNDRNDDVSGYTLRPPLVRITGSKNVTLSGVTLRNSPFWNTHVVFSEDVTVHDVTVENPVDAPNGDGLDVDSSHAVRISDSHFDVGDDAICLKAGKGLEGRRIGRPTQGVTITNCTVHAGHGGVVVGSETAGGVRDVTVSNCAFAGTDRGIRIKTRRGRGGVVENMQFRGIVMRRVACPITVNARYMGSVDDGAEPVDEGTPTVRDLHFDTITAREADTAGVLLGLPERPVSNVTLADVDVAIDPTLDAPWIEPAMVDGLALREGLYCRAIADFALRDARIETRAGPAIEVANGGRVSLTGIRPVPGEDAPAVDVREVEEVLVTGCGPFDGTFVRVGPRVGDVSLAGSHGDVVTAVETDGDPDGASTVD